MINGDTTTFLFTCDDRLLPATPPWDGIFVFVPAFHCKLPTFVYFHHIGLCSFPIPMPTFSPPNVVILPTLHSSFTCILFPLFPTIRRRALPRTYYTYLIRAHLFPVEHWKVLISRIPCPTPILFTFIFHRWDGSWLWRCGVTCLCRLVRARLLRATRIFPAFTLPLRTLYLSPALSPFSVAPPPALIPPSHSPPSGISVSSVCLIPCGHLLNLHSHCLEW